MRKVVFLFFIFVFIVGCGDNAPKDAIVTGPDDSTFAATPRSSASSTVRFRPLDFFAKNKDGDPLPDIEIQFFSTGIALLTDIDGALLSNSDRFTTKTDDAGVGRISISVTIPGCIDTNNITVTGGVLATVGSASDNFTGTVTRACSTTTTN